MHRMQNGIIAVATFMARTGVWAKKPEETYKQPNIIMYMIYDLGWNYISSGLGTMDTHTGVFQTPHLEKLTYKGLSFS